MLSTTLISSSSSYYSQLICRTTPGLFAVKSRRWDYCGGGSRRNYAKPSVTGIAGLGKKKLGKAGPVIEKKVLPVETDPVKLVNYCCGLNFLKEGGEEVKLKDDSEYPDWLWTLNTGPPLPLDQLDPDTDEYWDRINTLSEWRWSSMLKLKKF